MRFSLFLIGMFLFSISVSPVFLWNVDLGIQGNYLLTSNAWGTYGNAVITKAGVQYGSVICSDGIGGAIIAWIDDAAGNLNIYTQRISSDGMILWQSDGIPICTELEEQSNIDICSDEHEGAIIVWEDRRNIATTNYDIYAQRIDQNGNRLWGANGTAICNASESQNGPAICMDEHGGAIISWLDNRNQSVTNTDIYAQRIDSNGNFNWTSNGTLICNDVSVQTYHKMIADGTGGAIIGWVDERNGLLNDVYVQRVNSSGNTKWADNGTEVCKKAEQQMSLVLCNDGLGGAIIAWWDNRVDGDIYAQYVNVTGNLKWEANGTGICNYTQSQREPAICKHDDGGVIITWRDRRAGESIYAQHIDLMGTTHWTPNGTRVANSTTTQINNRGILATGENIYHIIWDTGGMLDDHAIFTQKINSIGSYLGNLNGIERLPTSYDAQLDDFMVTSLNNLILCWDDTRTGNPDVYALLITDGGTGVTPFDPFWIILIIIIVAVGAGVGAAGYLVAKRRG